MKRVLFLVILLLSICSEPAYAIEPLEFPVGGALYEDINVTSAETASYVINNSSMISLFTDKKPIIAVVYSLQNLSINGFTQELFLDWKLGPTTILTVISPNDGEVCIQAGKDLITEFPQNKINDIQKKVLQCIAAKDYDKAVMTAHIEVAKVLKPDSEGKAYPDYAIGKKPKKEIPLNEKYIYTMYPKFDEWRPVYDQARLFSNDVRELNDSLLGGLDDTTGNISVLFISLKETAINPVEYKANLIKQWKLKDNKLIINVLFGDKYDFLTSPDLSKLFTGAEIKALKDEANKLASQKQYDKVLEFVTDKLFDKITALERNQISESNTPVVAKQKNAIVMEVGNTWMSIDENLFPVDPVSLAAKPEIKNGRAFIPISPLIIILGGQITWDGPTQKVMIQLEDHKIELQIGKKSSIVDGVFKELEIAPYISNSRTMLPLRFVIENLGYEVIWNGKNQITIPLKDETDPHFNPEPLFGLQVSKDFDSLLTLPYKNLYVKDGNNLLSNIKQPDGIKEMMDLSYNGAEINITLFYTDNDAKEYYDFDKDVIQDYETISLTSGEGNNQYYITKIKRARCDPEGWYAPMSYSTCSASFLKQNAVISFNFDLRDEITDKNAVINEAVEYFGDLLNDSVK